MLLAIAARARKNHSQNPNAITIWAKLIAYYPMQETTLSTGSHLVDTIGGKDLVIAGAGTLSSAAGKVGNAITSVPNVYATATTFPTMSTSGISVFTWVKSTAAVASNYIFNNWNGAGFGFTAGSSNAAKIRFLLSAAGTQIVTTATSYNDGAWHFLVANWSSGNPVSLYLDDMTIADASSGTVTGSLSSSGNVTAFAQLGPASYWTGSLEQCAVLNAPLTLSERQYLYNGGLGISFTQLKTDSGH